MSTKKEKKSLVSVIKTGKVPGRRNLFKSLFTLIGASNAYGGIKYSDGERQKNNKTRRVVVHLKDPKYDITLSERLELLRKYIDITYIRPVRIETEILQPRTTLNIVYKNVNWAEIDNDIAVSK